MRRWTYVLLTIAMLVGAVLLEHAPAKGADAAPIGPGNRVVLSRLIDHAFFFASVTLSDPGAQRGRRAFPRRHRPDADARAGRRSHSS